MTGLLLSVPSWLMTVNFWDAANNAVQATAILIGGGFAYMKYVRGRIHFVSLSLEVEGNEVIIEGRKYMRILTKIVNSGTSTVAFDVRSRQTITVRCIDSNVLAEGSTGSHVEWSALPKVQLDQLVDSRGRHDATTSLEPGESESLSRLLALHVGDWAAYRVTFTVVGRRRIWLRLSKPLKWRTSTIVMAQ